MSHSRRGASPVFVKYKLGFLHWKVNQNRGLRQFMAQKTLQMRCFSESEEVLSESMNAKPIISEGAALLRNIGHFQSTIYSRFGSDLK